MAPSPRQGRDKPDQYELLYNSAVQAFVRRDHSKTQTALDKLLALTRNLPRDPEPWYTLSGSSLASEEWVTKTLKLAISANASLYSDPPRNFSHSDMAKLLPPAPPSSMLEHIKQLCISTYGAPLLPPQLLSTFLLAALKLRPSDSALAFAHALAEDWLTTLPDSFVHAIAQPVPATASAAVRKRTDAAREGYIKVVELFVGEVLGREGEWEMARGLLEGEMVMGSKKKEALYRHLRQLENQRSPVPSPSSSGLLPSPSGSGILPETPTRGSRSRSTTTSSSSSEATARPAGALDGGFTSRAVKGKQPQPRDESEGGDSTIQPAKSEATEVPSKIYVHHGSGRSSPVRPERRPGFLHTALAVLPSSLAVRLEALSRSGWLIPALLPFPIILILAFIGLQRRQRRAGVLTVRDRLRMARVQGLGGWLALLFKWWGEKLAGVWKLGTTITYV